MSEPTPAPAPAPMPAPKSAPAPKAPEPPKSMPKPTMPPAPKPNTQPAQLQSELMNAQDVAEQVLSTLKLLFPSIDVERRFLAIVSDYVQGNTEVDAVKKQLAATVEDRGADLDAQTIDVVLKTADDIAVNMKTMPRTPKAQYQPPSGTFTPSFDQVKEKLDKERITRTADKATELVEDIFSNVNKIFDDTPAVTINTEATKPEKSLIPEEPLTSVDDPHALIMGPIDELANMNVTEFRRLSSAEGEEGAVQRMLDKFNLLGQESIAKRAEGIDAWKSSALNQTYVRIGNASLQEGKPVGDVIESMKAAGEDTLSEKEFDAIADLNKHIRF